MQPELEAALIAGVAFLRELPRERVAVATARARLPAFRAAHPGLRIDLLVDQPPGSPRVDYDLFFGGADGSTIALNWRADAGLPWVVEYADHWAANFVVTVNRRDVTVQEALLFLQLAGQDRPGLMERLVEEKLVALALEADPPEVGDAEVQAAADRFRTAHRLHSAAATARWLEEAGLSRERFTELARAPAERRQLEERIAGDRIEPYFATHRPEFERVRCFRVDARSEAVAARLAAAAREPGLLDAAAALFPDLEDGETEAALRSEPAGSLPASLAAAAAGAIVGPEASGGRWWVAQVLSRRPAQLDEETRAVIRRRLFREWLARQREEAVVRWHWM
jgi:putative peptide maturation system protein